MRWRSGLMGFSSIAKTPVSHGVEPHDLETVRTFAFVFSSLKLSASHRRNYRASGFVLTSIRDVTQTSQMRKDRSFTDSWAMRRFDPTRPALPDPRDPSRSALACAGRGNS